MEEQTARLQARTTASIYATLKRAAELKERSLSNFVIRAAHDAAQHAIEDEGIFRLATEEQLRFAEALISPPAPSDALRKEVRLHATWTASTSGSASATSTPAG